VVEVVRQKFASDRDLRAVLLSTGDKILAEAAPNDCIWGIGLSVKDGRVQDPSQWQGQNVLGTALMQAREHFRGNGDSTHKVAAQGGEDSPSSSCCCKQSNGRQNATANFTRATESCIDAPQAALEAVALEATAPEPTPSRATANCKANEVKMPVMSDSAGEPLLLYLDDATGGTCLSSASAPLRLIFLDVDGVLNNKSCTQSTYDSGVDFSEVDVLVPECLACLQSALDETQAHVVLSSTWRSDSQLRSVIVGVLEQMRPGCVVGQTPQDPSYRNDVRPSEIASFLADPHVARAMDSNDGCWCAVDDMNLVRQAEDLGKCGCKLSKRLLPALRGCFVRTIKEVGLDGAGSQQICDILTRNRDVEAARFDATGSMGSESRQRRWGKEEKKGKK
jgi:hypothetical protein